MERLTDKVKRKLWQNGYSVKDVSSIPTVPCDLVVEGKYEVKVIEKGGDIDSTPKKMIVAIVDGDQITYHLCRKGTCWEEESITKTFPKITK